MKREISKQREQFVPRMQRKQGTYENDKGAKNIFENELQRQEKSNHRRTYKLC